MRVWAGTTNHADIDAVIERFGNIPWQDPSTVQLLIQDQEQNHFRLYMIRDDAVIQLAPEDD